MVSVKEERVFTVKTVNRPSVHSHTTGLSKNGVLNTTFVTIFVTVQFKLGHGFWVISSSLLGAGRCTIFGNIASCLFKKWRSFGCQVL